MIRDKNIKPENEKVSIIEQYPTIKTDLSLLKLIMNPFELLVFKFFFWKMPPKTIRSIFDEITYMIFARDFLWSDNETTKNKYYKEINDYGFLELLELGGYKNSKIMDNYKKLLDNQSKVSSTQFYYLIQGILKEHNIKFPSYEKIKSVCEKFEENDILTKQKKGTNYYYSLNPNFYIKMSEKEDELLNI